jgi:hypothetical protein
MMTTFRLRAPELMMEDWCGEGLVKEAKWEE